MFKGISFNRQEFSGAFGDIGTDLPLIVAMLLATGLYAPGVLIVFGLLQIATGLIYKMPMPVQPLKAMATLVIAQQIGGPILLGAGIAIGVVMLLLSWSGALDLMARWVPKPVIRGIQLGLGLSLCGLAFQKYIPSMGNTGYVMAALSAVFILIFIDRKKIPVSVFLIFGGALYAWIFHPEVRAIGDHMGLYLPQLHLPTWEHVTQGFLLLALPQIPLSLGNSIIATKQVSADLFPEKKPLTIRRIGTTYGLMNIAVPFLGGLPVCHGSGGMMGHYIFGGRTGGSVIIYGLFYIFIGLFMGMGFEHLVQIFPLPVLGVILIFEGLALMLLLRDMAGQRKHFALALFTGIMAFGLPYGFLIALIAGSLLYYTGLRFLSLHAGTDTTDTGSDK
jgi:hypothetical protein